MGSMSPMQLAWAAAVIVVVLLYIHWGGRATHATATLGIWEQALKRRTIWSRWRRLASLIWACVPILLIALALSGPFFVAELRSARQIVLVIDNTASMNAVWEDQTRLALAKQQARRMIHRLRTRDEMAILTADSAVRARCGMTGNKTLLLATVDSISPTDGDGAVSAALAAARRLAASQNNGVTAVLSDGAFEGAAQLANEGNMVWTPVGEAADNVGITRFAARPQPGSRTQYDVLIELRNFGQSPVQASVELSTAGATATTSKFDLAAGAFQQQVATIDVSQPGTLTAHLQHEDAVAADNWAQLLISPARRTRVIMLGDEDPALAAAVNSLRDVEVETAGVLSADLGESPDHVVLVYNGQTPAALPQQPALFLGPTQSAGWWEYVGQLEAPGAIAQQPHPLLDGVDLRDVVVDEAAQLRIEETSGATILATAADGWPMLAVKSNARGDTIVLAFDTAGSDLAVRREFPRLIASAVDWLARDNRPQIAGWTTGDTFVQSSQSSSAELLSPYGQARRSREGAQAANLVQVGQWQLRDENSDVAQAILPVNLLNAGASDANSRAQHALQGQLPSSPWPDIGPLWSILAALALVWVVGQWVMYQKGVID